MAGLVQGWTAVGAVWLGACVAWSIEWLESTQASLTAATCVLRGATVTAAAAGDGAPDELPARPDGGLRNLAYW